MDPKWQQRFLGIGAKWAKKLFGVKRFRKASGCAARHDARIASEHLALFPVSGPKFSTNFVRNETGFVYYKQPNPAVSVN